MPEDETRLVMMRASGSQWVKLLEVNDLSPAVRRPSLAYCS